VKCPYTSGLIVAIGSPSNNSIRESAVVADHILPLDNATAAPVIAAVFTNTRLSTRPSAPQKLLAEISLRAYSIFK
jgi:hypothetical protein